RLHDLVRLFARAKADGARSDAALHRLVDYYIATIANFRTTVTLISHPLSGITPPRSQGRDFNDARQAMEWRNHEETAMLALIHQVCRQTPNPLRPACDLLRSVWNLGVPLDRAAREAL